MDIGKNLKPLSGEVDWPLWKRKIQDLLDYHEGTLDVIEGRLVRPSELEASASEAEQRLYAKQEELFRKANSIAKSMITSALKDEVYQKVMDRKTAKEMWEALIQEFEASSQDQLFQLCSQFFAFSWTLEEDVSTHAAKLRRLWTDLNLGLKQRGEHSLPELLLVSKVLSVLPGTFSSFQSSWLLMKKDDEYSYEELVSRLQMFERQFVKPETAERLVQGTYATQAQGKPATQNQGKPAKAQKLKKTRGNDVCHYCKKKGHWLRECRKWIADGKPAKSKSSDGSQDTNQHVKEAETSLLLCTADAFDVEKDNNWWIDNGATKHVCKFRDAFQSYEPFSTPCQIRAAGQETLPALGQGTVRVRATLEDGLQIEHVLTEVWHVPTLNRNLFSVLATQDLHHTSEFKSTTTKCWLFVDGKNKVFGSREHKGTLFKAHLESVAPHQVFACEENTKSLLNLYHQRWGHQSLRHVKDKLKADQGITVDLKTDLCEPCLLGKSHRLPFHSHAKASSPGELLSADVCGPFPESYKGQKYLVVFKDYYTKFRFGYLIKKKSDVPDLLDLVLAHAKTEGHPIKQFLTDNGGEFDNNKVRSLLQREGIQQRLTAPYTPEQNGSSERDFRTIVEMIRTLRFSKGGEPFPEKMWAELARTAIYILNRTGPSRVKEKSPYEVWTGRKPRISHLRVIGSTCYVHIPKEKRSKLEAKAIEGILIGYDGDERYRIWTPCNNKVLLSRDIVFNETISFSQDNSKVSEELLNQGKSAEKPVTRSYTPSPPKDDSRSKEMSDCHEEEEENSEETEDDDAESISPEQSK